MVYIFVCDRCDHKFEVIRPMAKADKSAKCPKCKKKSRRIYEVGGIHGVEGSWRVNANKNDNN